MENPEIQSSRFPDVPKHMYAEYDEDEVDLIARARRRGRKTAAEEFQRGYFYGRCKDKKTCIWPGGDYSWSDDESSGITWVGVHGNDSICVVTKAGHLDMTRVHGFLLFLTKEEVLRNFRRTVISEIEDLANPADPSSKLCGKSIKTPFSVVSVVPLTDKVHKASSNEFQESKIMTCLLKDLNREDGELVKGINMTWEQHIQTYRNSSLLYFTSSDDEYEIDEDDEDACIKYCVKLSRRHRRTLPVLAGYDAKKTIRLLKEEMKRDAAITINETVQESCDEYDENKAIKFLEEKMMKTVEDFTLEETIQTAIYAFQHLFKKNFKANEIEVCVMDPNYFVFAEEAYYKDVYVKHLETSEIEQLLADMNEPGSGGSSSGGLSMTYEGRD